MPANPRELFRLATSSALSARANEVSPGPTAAKAPIYLTQGGPAPGVATRGAPGGPENISPNPANDTTGNVEDASPTVPTSAPPRVGLFPQFGASLLSKGIDVHGVAFDQFLANPSAGVRPGNLTNVGEFSPAVDVDLGRLAGIPGGNVHVRLTTYALKSDKPLAIQQFGGQEEGYQATPSLAKTNLSVLTYEQRLLGDRLSIEVGRTNIHRYFFLPNSVDPFTYYSPTIETNGDFNPPPFPVWGGRVTYRLTPAWFVQAGAFEDNFLRKAVNSNNFGTNGATGASVIAELGYRTEFSNAAYPANLELGAEWNTRGSAGNIKAIPAVYNGRNAAAPYEGGGNLFLSAQKVVWRGTALPYGPPPNIAVFTNVGVAVDKPQPFDLDTLFGVNFTGLIPGRPFDAIGLTGRYSRLSAVEAAFETRVANILAGRGPSQSRDGFQFEVAANIQLTQSISLTPTVQYYVSPDAYDRAAQRGRPQDGFVAGIFATVSLGRLLGTSQKPF